MTKARKIALTPSTKRSLINYTYEAKNIPLGAYDLIYVDNRGNGKKIDGINLKPDEIKTQNIEEVGQTGDVKLKIQDLNGKNLIDTEVILNELDKEFTTNSNGEVQIDNLPKGTYSLTIKKDGFVSHYKTFVITSAQTTNLQTIQLNDKKGKVSGTVIVEGISNFANIIVYAKSSDSSVFSTLTDKLGNYKFNAIPVGTGYSILAFSHDFEVGQIENINVALNSDLTLNPITIKRKSSLEVGSISGYARLEQPNKPDFAGIIVSVENSDKEAITTRDGAFVINNIKAGTYTLNFTDSNSLGSPAFSVNS